MRLRVFGRELSLLEGPTEKALTRAKAWDTKGGTDLTQDPTRTFPRLRGYRNIYKQGGYISTGIDLYPLYTFGEWYTIESKNAAKKKETEEFFDGINFNAITTALMVDGLTVRDGVGEIVYGKGLLSNIPVNVIVRPGESFDFTTDLKGAIISYDQVRDNRGNTIPTVSLKPEQVLHYQFSLDPTSPYGISLIERAVHDAKRDTKGVEAITGGICLHGTPKYHVKANSTQADRPPLSDKEFADLEKQFEGFNAKDQFITEGDIVVQALDTTGVPNVQQYSDVTMFRVCAAIGVPPELLGLRQGTSDATAVSRIAAFFKQIKLVQKDIERMWNTKVIDKRTGEPGLVKIKLNSASMDDFIKMAAAISMLRAGSDVDAVCPADWCRERLNIPKDERTDEEKPKKQEFPPGFGFPGGQVPTANDKGNQDPDQLPGKSEEDIAATKEMAAAAHELSQIVRKAAREV
jgi:hypothetical protein